MEEEQNPFQKMAEKHKSEQRRNVETAYDASKELIQEFCEKKREMNYQKGLTEANLQLRTYLTILKDW